MIVCEIDLGQGQAGCYQKTSTLAGSGGGISDSVGTTGSYA